MSIALFKKYIDKLDEVYKIASTTSVLDGDNTLVRQGANANEIVIPKMTLDGLATYSRASGYVSGDVSLAHETVTFNYDRGRKFTVDAMDNEETAGVAFGQLAAEFIRTKVAPELDAFRFATYAQTSSIGGTTGTISTAADLMAALSAAGSAMDEQEVGYEQRYLFITPTLYNMILTLDTTKSREVLETFAGIIRVPQTRFYNKITLYDGTTSGQEAGGYIKDATNGKDINFMVIHKPAVLQYSKHVVDKVISPEANQSSDGWMFFYRSYGLCDVYDNKVKGVYLHRKA